MCEDENPRIRTNERMPMSEEQTSENIDNESSGKIFTTHHKYKETTIFEDPEDTNVSLGGLRTSSEDHLAQTKEEKEDLSSSKKGKNAYKVSITSAFNTLNPLR